MVAQKKEKHHIHCNVLKLLSEDQFNNQLSLKIIPFFFIAEDGELTRLKKYQCACILLSLSKIEKSLHLFNEQLNYKQD